MEGSTAKTNIDHLVYLGFHTNIQGRRWKELFKKNTTAKCMGCGNKIRVTDPISKTNGLRYFSHRHIPEVHWIFNFQLNPEDASAVEECKQYFSNLSNKDKKMHMFPCCYKCWHIATHINKNYYTLGVEEYYTKYKTENPEYVNWNIITLEQCQTEEQRQAKIMQYYEYIRDWCAIVNVCCHTDNGLKYCSKPNGKCIHTNPNWTAPQKSNLHHNNLSGRSGGGTINNYHKNNSNMDARMDAKMDIK